MKLYRDFTSQEEIDQEYNVQSLVPDMEPYVEFFVSESEKARNELECVLDVRFGPTVDEIVDVFPAEKPGAPILVFIHGGYWRALSSKEFNLVARGLHAHGITVVVTNYSLCPKVTITEITRQSRAAIAWLYQKAGSLNGDPERIFVVGHSAGGQQVSMLMVTDWQGEYGLPKDIIKGGIAISGVFDLQPLRYSWLQPTLLLTHEVIMQQSPCFQIPSSAPPLFITLGAEETAEFHRQSKDYLAAWQSQGLQGELDVQPDKNHFTAIDGFIDANSPLCEAVIDFMKRCEK